jgi:hypothetical protein
MCDILAWWKLTSNLISQITLVFTIVTVFFVSTPLRESPCSGQHYADLLKLPLSFMSSVFAIQIDAFPHNFETGEVNWPVGEAMGLICASFYFHSSRPPFQPLSTHN